MDNNTLERYFNTVLSSHRVMLDAVNTLKQQEETIRQLANLPARENTNEQPYVQTAPNMYFPVPTRPYENGARVYYPNRTNTFTELFAQHLRNAINNSTPVVVRPTELQIEQATENMLFSELPPEVERIYTCPVSHDTFRNNSEITRICHCGHYFGREAIMTWFSMNVHCPICRYDIRNVTAEDEPSPTNDMEDPAPQNTALYYEFDFSF